jgi:choline dehydrogenase-like flavoprotein
MATRMQPVDVVLVGMGFTGGILAKELAEASLSAVGLERGVWRDTVPDFQSPAMHDELRYLVYIDTLMIQQVLSVPQWHGRLTAADLRATSSGMTANTPSITR